MGGDGGMVRLFGVQIYYGEGDAKEALNVVGG